MSDENKRRIYDRSEREVPRGQAEGARAGHRHYERQDHGFEDSYGEFRHGHGYQDPHGAFRHDHGYQDPYAIFREVFGDTDPFELVDNLLTRAGATATTRAVTNIALRLGLPLGLRHFL